MIQSLFPFPGSKADAKYDRHLYPSLDAKAIAEPFMGGASRSIRYSHLLTYLGEINPAQRAISLVLHNPNAYIRGYMEAYDRFWLEMLPQYEKMVRFVGVKNSQTALRAAMTDVYTALTVNWKGITHDLYQWMHSTLDPRMAGVYAFCIRACFGNVMRLNPKQTHFNVTWHIDKLTNACQYSPEQWVAALQAKQWNPNVFCSWEEAIAAVPNPSTTWCLLDPPYICSDTAKMTPCYPGHQVTTKDGMNTTFNLAVDSLKAALERGFNTISVCNYYDPTLDTAIQRLTTDASYSATAHLLGECKALGNSNGRYKHGGRMDKRDRPVEVIYRISRIKKLQWSGFTALDQRSSQLNLWEAVV